VEQVGYEGFQPILLTNVGVAHRVLFADPLAQNDPRSQPLSAMAVNPLLLLNPRVWL
jgi:hypothetical protein